MSDVSKAFLQQQTEGHVGKTVLTVPLDVTVPMLQRSLTPNFLPGASYLLVGGVGGIGCSIARWMADEGAKNIIVLSRSAARGEQASALVHGLSQLGCRVKPVSCDVSSKAGLADSLRHCQEDGLPPIRGVIQGAMVLKVSHTTVEDTPSLLTTVQDTLLERMTLADYQTAIHPKVHGTWNLHTHFAQADSLDFFVMLSSAVAIAGNASQASYAAGGSYQDALAHWRVSQGLPATSINLGAVKDIGVATKSGALGHLQRVGYLPIHEEQVLSILCTAILHPYDPQVVVGLDPFPGSHWDANGVSQLGRDMRFAALKPRETDSVPVTNRTGAPNLLASKLATTESLEQAVDYIGAAIADKISDIFMIPRNDVDLAIKPAQYGIDSLVAVELRNMLVQQAAAEVSIFDIMQSVSLAALAATVAAKSAYVSK